MASVHDRIAFWERLRPRLQALGNRINTDQRISILAAVHARIPAPMPDEMEDVSQIGHRTKTDRKYDAMLTEIVAQGGTKMANRLRNESVKRAERRTIKLIWEYLQVLKQQRAASP